jgi:preprotein translocase subunit YajC
MIWEALIFMCGVWLGVIFGIFLASAISLGRQADEQTQRQLNEMDAGDPYIARTTIYQGNETKEI